MRDNFDTFLRVLRDLCFGLAIALLIFAFTVGCPIIKIVVPAPPTPTPTPVAVTCPDGFPPGPTGCPTKPPDSPKPPDPPVKPGGDIVSGEWEMVVPRPEAGYTLQLNGAMQSLTEQLHLTNCEPQSRCVVPFSLNGWLGTVAVEMRNRGFYAGIQPGADELCIGVVPHECQGYHIYVAGQTPEKGTIGWAPGSVRDTWHARSQPDVGPDPTTYNCPPLGRITLNVRQQTRLIVDATPQTSDKEWCNANGFQGRNNCPMGQEGTAQRPYCEEKAGPYVWTVAGGTFFLNDNPLQIIVTSYIPHGKVEIRGGNGVGAVAELP